MHEPVKKEIALVCDDEWEGPHNCYASVVKVGDVLRLYYRADAGRHRADGTFAASTPVICVAESTDGGITFQKPDLGMIPFNGTCHNNIIFTKEDELLDNFFIGFPTRYLDRSEDKENFRHMPLADRREVITKHFGREGTSVTDCVIMTSADGFVFNRRDEAFLKPGIENRYNWWYGNCYPVYGLVETKAEEPSAPNEISFYGDENYRIKSANFRRYTVRLDGFFSWYAPFCEGEVVTKPLTVSKGEMRVNFSTSALGGMVISLCSEEGSDLAGYTSYTMFGDSTDRPVSFQKPLEELIGKKVRLKIRLKDAHLYSFVI